MPPVFAIFEYLIIWEDIAKLWVFVMCIFTHVQMVRFLLNKHLFKNVYLISFKKAEAGFE
ncbi:hypothetical protein CN458_27120 [Bacillus cereus]|nr:hypothetical protein CN458_27120 [Bacillus cereus]